MLCSSGKEMLCGRSLAQLGWAEVRGEGGESATDGHCGSLVDCHAAQGSRSN